MMQITATGNTDKLFYQSVHLTLTSGSKKEKNVNDKARLLIILCNSFGGLQFSLIKKCPYIYAMILYF